MDIQAWCLFVENPEDVLSSTRCEGRDQCGTASGDDFQYTTDETRLFHLPVGVGTTTLCALHAKYIAVDGHCSRCIRAVSRVQIASPENCGLSRFNLNHCCTGNMSSGVEPAVPVTYFEPLSELMGHP